MQQQAFLYHRVYKAIADDNRNSTEGAMKQTPKRCRNSWTNSSDKKIIIKKYSTLCIQQLVFARLYNPKVPNWSTQWCNEYYPNVLTGHLVFIIWAPSSDFMSSSIPSWQILTAHAQPFRGARDLAFCLKVPLDSLLVWASSGGSGETARMRRLAWTFAARIGDKYQIRLTRPIFPESY